MYKMIHNQQRIYNAGDFGTFRFHEAIGYFSDILAVQGFSRRKKVSFKKEGKYEARSH